MSERSELMRGHADRFRRRSPSGDMKRLSSVAVVVAVCAALLAACGLPKDRNPREIAADKIPSGLIGPSTTTQADANVPGGSDVTLYFVDGAKLRKVPRTAQRRDVREVLDQLVQGLGDRDPLGITTAIPKDTKVIDTQFEGQNLVVTLSNEMLNVQSTEQRNAFAQLVYTASDLGVQGVIFRVLDSSGNPEDVQPVTDSGTHGGALSKGDYLQEAPN
jgi:Sporulation and spore germination